MGQLELWPPVVDSDGTPGSGTAFNKSFFDSVRDAILDEVFDPANPTTKVKELIAEVGAARGSKVSLDARLDVAHNEDGTLKAIAGIVSNDTVSRALPLNYLANGDLLIWPNGDTSSPAYMTLGAGTISRNAGGPLAPICGDNWALLGPNSQLSAYLVPTGELNAANSRWAFLRGSKWSFGCYLYCSAASIGMMTAGDGVGSAQAYDIETGDATIQELAEWRWVAGTITIDDLANHIRVIISNTGGAGNVLFQGLTMIPGDVLPTAYIPCPGRYHTLTYRVAGAIPNNISYAGAHTKIGSYAPNRPAYIKDVRLDQDTAPATTATKVDVKVENGAGTMVSIFSGSAGAPTVAVGAKHGSAQPDGTYQRRCLQGAFGALFPAGSKVFVDIGQTAVAVGDPGTELDANVRLFQYERPFEAFYEYND